MLIKKDRCGFTIMEMMVVVAVMAIIASLVTGAAVKAIKSSRYKRIQATKVVLQAAIENYHAQEGEWPFDLHQMYQSTKKKSLYYAYDQTHPRINVDNSVVFNKMLSSTTPYLDGSALLARVNGRRMTVQQALANHESKSEICIGYPNPANTKQFFLYAVRYNSDTDSVNVYDKSDIDNMGDQL